MFTVTMPRTIALTAITFSLACASREPGTSNEESDGPLVVYAAGSLARPLRAALDSFAAQSGAAVAASSYNLETAGSLETARKLTELGKTPDVIALADAEVFPQLLMPEHVHWYVIFAGNRMVLAKSPKARFAGEVSGDNWWQIVQRPGVEVGRADPDVDPAGYRTLLVFQLTEKALGQPGLAAALERASPRRNMRPKSAELTALLQTGELDYAWEYESVARAANVDFVRLAPRLDLGSSEDSAFYATARVDVRGASARDTLHVSGMPIRYALAIPRAAARPAAAERFVAYLLGESGRRVLGREYLEVLATPRWVGDSIPAPLAATQQ